MRWMSVGNLGFDIVLIKVAVQVSSLKLPRPIKCPICGEFFKRKFLYFLKKKSRSFSLIVRCWRHNTRLHFSFHIKLSQAPGN